jgi:hypothetical protein
LVLSQKRQLTQRAPNWWESPRFQAGSWLEAGSAKAALPRPTHQRVTQAVGHLLLQSFWANEAIFQLMMLAYNLFLLFKMDFVRETEYRQQIKTFRLKYIFLAGKIIRTARSVDDEAF